MDKDDVYEDADYPMEKEDDKYLGPVLQIDDAKRKMIESLLKMSDGIRDERRRLLREKTSKLQMIEKAYDMRTMKLSVDLQKIEDSAMTLIDKATFYKMKREHLESMRLAREASDSDSKKPKELNTSMDEEDDEDETGKTI